MTLKRIRNSAVALLFSMILCFALVMSAAAAYWGSVSIGMGSYQTFIAASTDSGYYPIDGNTTLTHTINFSNVASSSVKAGYIKSYTFSPTYSAMLSGTGSKKMSGSYTISKTGKYKFYIYNGSSSVMNMSSMTVTW